MKDGMELSGQDRLKYNDIIMNDKEFNKNC